MCQSRISTGASHPQWGQPIEIEFTGKVEFFNGEWHRFYKDKNGNLWVSSNGGGTVSNWNHNIPVS